MNNYRVILTKVQQQDLVLFKNALNHFAGTMNFLHETMDNRKYMKDLSIAVELWYDFNTKTAGQDPAVNSRLKLPLHQALVLIDALQVHTGECENQYEKNRCNRYIMAIDQQLPTKTQLIIQKH